jgi:oxygen-independent coproporphyrinogen-3 oxidase
MSNVAFDYIVKLHTLAGIYIHIPFCKQTCNYCNFHFTTNIKKKELFIEALKKEILSENEFIPNAELIESIYFGGGTPSLLLPSELDEILSLLHKKFKVQQGAEITLEANPDDINSEILFEWYRLGINRLSVGVQTFLNEELQWMNRAHTAEHSLNCIKMINASLINNYSVDLIFGSPLLTDDDLKKNLSIIIKNQIPHISCYALTIEKKTPLYKAVKNLQSKNIDTNKQADQFLLVLDTLENYGYEQYEISNYAKPGMRSKHNSSYWQNKPYYGFGPSAHAFDGKNTRKWNISNTSIYIQQAGNEIISEKETLNSKQQLNEFLMTSLRTREGIDLSMISNLYGVDYANTIKTAISKFTSGGKLIHNDGRIQLTREGKLFADGIAADLFF